MRLTAVRWRNNPAQSKSTDDYAACVLQLHTERAKLLLFGEVFNVLNYANLGGYNNQLTSSTFGQPTSVPSQVLGSGGPRIFQLGGRIQF